jgi:preprotein translocase subunit SecF
MSNKFFLILFIVVIATIILFLADDFNKRLGMQEGKTNKLGESVSIQEEKVNKLVEKEASRIFSLRTKRKIGFNTD